MVPFWETGQLCVDLPCFVPQRGYECVDITLLFAQLVALLSQFSLKFLILLSYFHLFLRI